MARVRDPNVALGCIEYDMYVLASALLLRRAARSAGSPRVLRDATQLAADALFLKARSLLEFLTSKRRMAARIRPHDFGFRPIPMPKGLRPLFGYVSQRCAHLSWARAQEPLLVWKDVDGTGLQVLRLASDFCAEARRSGFRLGAPRHRRRHPLVERKLAALFPGRAPQPA